MLNSLDSFLLCPQGGRFWHVLQVQTEEHLCLHSPTGEQMDFCAPSGQHHWVSSWIHQITVVDQRGANTTDQDVVSWCWTTDGMYTTRSTYKAMFWGSYSSTCSQTFWKALAENKVKKFCWHLSLGRILTVDKLIQRGWQGSEICSMCSSQEETVEHLLLNFYFARQVWRRIAAWSGFETLWCEDGLREGTVYSWWLERGCQIPTTNRRKFDGTVAYTFCPIWKDRNGRVFDNAYAGVEDTFFRI